jgi:FemAB-related protein (PEP-CTERM system-associated)
LYSKTVIERDGMRVCLAAEGSQTEWDRFVQTVSEAGPYHLYAWKTAVERSYGHKGYYLMAREGREGSCVGVLPLVCLRMPWGSKALISLPYCDYGGPLGTPSARRVLLGTCQELARALGVNSVDLRCSSPEHQLSGPFAAPWEEHSGKVRMVLPLSTSSEALWAGFKSKLRSQVRRATKEGMEVALGGCELLSDFYAVHCENMHDLGSPTHDWRFFEELLGALGSSAQLAVVYHDGSKPVAAGMTLSIEQKVSMPWASSLRRFNRLAPNMLLYWSLLRWAADSGHLLFDFGRSTPGEGTYQFKSQWNAIPRPLSWYLHTSSSRPGEAPNGRHPLRPILERLWSSLPLSLANVLGPSVRGYISL